MHLQYSHSPYLSHFMFRIDRPIARISSSLVYTGILAVVFSLWRRDRNRMDSCRVSRVDVPESPIASGARDPDSSSSVIPCIVMNNDGGSVLTKCRRFLLSVCDYNLFAK